MMQPARRHRAYRAEIADPTAVGTADRIVVGTVAAAVIAVDVAMADAVDKGADAVDREIEGTASPNYSQSWRIADRSSHSRSSDHVRRYDSRGR